MSFLTLNEYLTGARKIMLSQKCGYLIHDEDAVAHVAYRMMVADNTWNGESSRDTWRFNQAKYGILRVLNNKKKDKHGAVKSLDYALGKDKDLLFVNTIQDESVAYHLAIMEDFCSVMEAAKSGLNTRQFDCIQLYYSEGLTQDEIGKKLGVTKQAVSLHIKAGIKKLKCMLQSD